MKATPLRPAGPEPSNATIGLDALTQQLAASSTLAPADIQATLVAFTELIQAEPTAGNWVALDSIGIITTSLSGRIPGPVDPLPKDSKVEIGFRADNQLRKNVRANASITRIDPNDQSPLLLALNLKVGDVLPNIRVNDVLDLLGDRLNVDPSKPDEGTFLVPTGGPALRIANYILNRDKKLLFALPTGIIDSTEYTLQVRNPRENTSWPALLIGAI